MVFILFVLLSLCGSMLVAMERKSENLCSRVIENIRNKDTQNALKIVENMAYIPVIYSAVRDSQLEQSSFQFLSRLKEIPMNNILKKGIKLDIKSHNPIYFARFNRLGLFESLNRFTLLNGKKIEASHNFSEQMQTVQKKYQLLLSRCTSFSPIKYPAIEKEKEEIIQINTEEAKDFSLDSIISPVEYFFKDGIESLTFLAHPCNHDLKNEYKERKTISAVPIIYPVTKQQFSFKFNIEFMDKEFQKKFNKEEDFKGFTAFSPFNNRKRHITNIVSDHPCSICEPYSVMQCRSCKKFLFEYVRSEEQNKQSLESEKIELRMQYRPHTNWHQSDNVYFKIPIKNDEKISILLTNTNGKTWVEDCPCTLFMSEKSDYISIISGTEREWMERMQTNDIDHLLQLIKDIESKKQASSDHKYQNGDRVYGKEGNTDSAKFADFKKQVIELCKQKIEALKRQHALINR